MKHFQFALRNQALYLLFAMALPLAANAQTQKGSTATRDSNDRDDIIELLNESDLPSAYDGFKWKLLPEINAAFQMPVDWYFLFETKEDTDAYFMSKEKIEGDGIYLTGLSINVTRNISEKIDGSATDYAKTIAYMMLTTSDTLFTGAVKTGSLSQFICRVRLEGEDGTTLIVHNLLIGNSKTDTFYMIIFEAPESEWEQADKIGQVMLTNFALDDDI